MKEKTEKEVLKKPEKVTFPSELKKRVKTEKKASTSNPFLYLGYFLLIVGLCIAIAFSLRMVFLYKKSTFSTTSYSVLINNKKNPFIVSFNKELQKISFIELENFEQGNKIKESLYYGVPLDGEIEAAVDVAPPNFSSYGSLFTFLINQFNARFSGLTILDISNVILSSQSVPRTGITIDKMSVSKDSKTEGLTQEELYDIFKDSNIIDEALSVEVINATEVKGLAGTVSQVLKNTGCNVISVSSGDVQKSSKISVLKKTKTAERLSHILGIQLSTVESLRSSADIQIVIGEDFVKQGKLESL